MIGTSVFSDRTRFRYPQRDWTRATGGLILLDRFGNPAYAFNTPRMAYGFVAPDGTFITAV
jgi:isoaspartyl peptidase/L-asparaginase-like protein (Ntn-hydrolase superfamily)